MGRDAVGGRTSRADVDIDSRRGHRLETWAVDLDHRGRKPSTRVSARCYAAKMRSNTARPSSTSASAPTISKSRTSIPIPPSMVLRAGAASTRARRKRRCALAERGLLRARLEVETPRFRAEGRRSPSRPLPLEGLKATSFEAGQTNFTPDLSPEDRAATCSTPPADPRPRSPAASPSAPTATTPSARRASE